MYKSFFKCVLMTLSLFTLYGCQSEKPISTLPHLLVLETYKPTGESIAKKSIISGDLLHTRLTTLLFQKDGDWKTSVTSYASIRYVFRSEVLIVRCLTNKVVIDVQTNSGWKSYERKQLGFIAKLGLEY